MPDWLNQVTVAAPRNGTTTHTVTPSSGTVAAGSLFTPTAGRFLLCLAEASVTSTTPDGWTLPANGSAVNNTGLYAWYLASAAGSDSITTTHNASNYPAAFHFFEFAPGSTFAGAASATAVFSGGGGPVLNLTGTNWTAGVFGAGVVNTSSASGSVAWNAGTEFVDTYAAYSTTDGYLYSLTATDADTSTSRSYAATVTGTFPAAERLVIAVAVSPIPVQSEGSRNSSAMARMRG